MSLVEDTGMLSSCRVNALGKVEARSWLGAADEVAVAAPDDFWAGAALAAAFDASLRGKGFRLSAST